ncbi:MAG: peroxiredoxin [Burkholderiales bacterium]
MIAWIALAVAIAVATALALWIADARTTRNRPKAGEPAPAFSLEDQNGTRITLDEFRGKWLVLYFYPRDDTPGCTEQAMRFRNAMREMEALGAVVCGVSVDSSESHAAFARKHKLPFALLADRDGKVAARYGSLRHLGVIKVAKRNTFLVDPQGRIAKVYAGVNAGRNAQEVMDDLRKPSLD